MPSGAERKARCKFKVTSVAHTAYEHKVVKLDTQYDESLPEDERFSKFTPSGTMEFMLNNPALDDFFVPGKAYYVDVTPCEE